MKQTSVEWLHEEYMRILKDNDISVLQAFEILDKYNQANEMFNEQIIEAHIKGHNAPSSTLKHHDAEQYYNKTYEKK
jgi:hypothetical protein